MPRIRSIKHDLYLDEDLARLPLVCRYAFPGLWTLADREGRLEDRPARIKAQLFPYEPEVDMDAALAQLAAGGFVVRYEVDGARYLQVRTFAQHQQVNARESQSRIPPPPGQPLPAPAPSSPAHVEDDGSGEDICTQCRARACTCTHVGNGDGIQGREGNGDTPRAREPRPGTVVPFDAEYGAMPTRPRARHCAWESTLGVDVPQQLHAEIVQKFTNAGQPEAEAYALAWYRRTEDAWRGRPFGDDTWGFWRARLRETLGTSASPSQGPTKVAGLAGGGVAASSTRPTWMCTHEPLCGHRTACALLTAREVRAGRLALEDVQPALAKTVQAMTCDDEQPSEAVHA